MRRMIHIQLLLPPKHELHIVKISFVDVFEAFFLRFIVHNMPQPKKCYSRFVSKASGRYKIFLNYLFRLLSHRIGGII